jgi:protein gp37
LNRTKIETCDYTWNPVTGCKHGCSYCYARRIAKRFKKSFRPTFHSGRIYKPFYIEKPSRIFVCSMADLFGDWVPEDWIKEIIDTAWTAYWHQFQFLTKNPKRLKDFNPWPKNCWVGASVTNQRDYEIRIQELKLVDAPVVFLSCEPLFSPISMVDIPDWLIIGAQTGPGAKKPNESWVKSIIRRAHSCGAAVFCKSNLHINTLPREWPEREGD